MPRNPIALPKSPAMMPNNAVLSDAPIPEKVPTKPCAKLNLPVPFVRSAINAAKTIGRIGRSANTSALTATRIAPNGTKNRFDRLASSNLPPGNWLNKPARPLTLRTYPMFCWVHFSWPSSTAANGPKPACIHPVEANSCWKATGLSSSAAVMAMALASRRSDNQ